MDKILFATVNEYVPRPIRNIRTTRSFVREKLGESYRLSKVMGSEFSKRITDILEMERYNEGYDPIVAIIAPVPANSKVIPLSLGESTYQHRKKNYSESLEILSYLNRCHKDLPVIAYTHAEKCEEIDELFKNEGKVKRVVHISPVERWQEDYLELKLALEEFIK